MTRVSRQSHANLEPRRIKTRLRDIESEHAAFVRAVYDYDAGLISVEALDDARIRFAVVTRDRGVLHTGGPR